MSVIHRRFLYIRSAISSTGSAASAQRQCEHWLGMTPLRGVGADRVVRPAHSKNKPHPFGWGFVFVTAHRFCCLHSRPPQGRGSVRGEPLTGSPTRVQSPARRRPLLRSKSAAPKKKDTHVGVFLFWSGRRGSNSLPRPWQGRALPDELRPQTQGGLYRIFCGLSTLHFRFARKNQNQGPKALSTPSISPPRRCFQCWDRSSPSSPSCPVWPAPAPRCLVARSKKKTPSVRMVFSFWNVAGRVEPRPYTPPTDGRCVSIRADVGIRPYTRSIGGHSVGGGAHRHGRRP